MLAPALLLILLPCFLLGYGCIAAVNSAREFGDPTLHQQTVVAFRDDKKPERDCTQFLATRLAADPSLEVVRIAANPRFEVPQDTRSGGLSVLVSDKLYYLSVKPVDSYVSLRWEIETDDADDVDYIRACYWAIRIYEPVSHACSHEERRHCVAQIVSILSGIVEAEPQFRDVRLLTAASMQDEHVAGC
jgi:hypothetical protein